MAARTLTVEVPSPPGSAAAQQDKTITLGITPTVAATILAIVALIAAVALYAMDQNDIARLLIDAFLALAGAAAGITLGENKAAKETAAQLGADGGGGDGGNGEGGH